MSVTQVSGVNTFYSYQSNVQRVPFRGSFDDFTQKQNIVVEKSNEKKNINTKKIVLISGAVLLAGLGIFLATRGRKGFQGVSQSITQTSGSVDNITKDGFAEICKVYGVKDPNHPSAFNMLESNISYNDFEKYLEEIKNISNPSEMLKYLKALFENPVEFKFEQSKGVIRNSEVGKFLEFVLNDPAARADIEKGCFNSKNSKLSLMPECSLTQNMENIITAHKNDARLFVSERFGKLYNDLLSNISNRKEAERITGQIIEKADFLLPRG